MQEVKSLSDFSESKDKLLHAYEDLKASGYVPVTRGDVRFSPENIDEYIANLSSEKFIVTVCGQIKVGKSTFLNDFIFASEVLPSADAPETAKLTEITYGEKPFFEAFYYSAEEWEDIKRQKFVRETGEEAGYYDEFIKPAVERLAAESGGEFSESAVISGVSRRSETFADIRDYVAVGGRYTPFVKYVRIEYPSPALSGIVLVDTPGTNDPNVVRKKVTEDWIGKSDAVVFIMYAGQALTSQDLKFVENYLLSVQPEKILVAVSKVDTVEHVKKPAEYVEKTFLKYENFRKIVEGGRVYSVAPIFSLYPKLLKKHESKEITLSPARLDEINFQLYDRGVAPEIVSGRGYMEEFCRALESHLVKARGGDALKSHVKKIETVFECNVNNLMDERKALEARIDAIGGNWKEVEKEAAQLLAMIGKVGETENEAVSKLAVNYQVFSSSLSDLFNEALAIGVKNDIFEIIAGRDPAALVSDLLWEARSAIENHLAVLLNKKVAAVVENFKNGIDEIRAYLRRQLLGLDLISETVFGVSFGAVSVEDLLRGNEKYLETALSDARLREAVKGGVLSTDAAAAKKKLCDIVSKILSGEDEFKSVIGKRKNDILREIKSKFAYIFEMAYNELYKKNRILMKVAKTSDRDAAEIERIKGLIAAVDEKIKAIGAKFRDIDPEFREGS